MGSRPGLTLSHSRSWWPCDWLLTRTGLVALGLLAALAPAGAPLTSAAARPSAAPTLSGITIGSGHVYVADERLGRIYVLSPTLALLNVWRVSPPGQPASVHFSGIASDGHGHIYAADENDRIFKLSSAGHVLSVWGSTGTGPGQFRQPWGIAVGPGGNILVADGQNHRVEIFSPAEKVLGQWQLYPQIDYPGGPCGLLYLAVAHTGTSYVVDDCYNRVLKLSPSGQILQRRPWRGTGRDRYSEVSGVAVGARGTVVVTGTFRIERFSPNGSVLGVIREPGFPGYAFCPAGIAVDGHGDLCVADPENYRVFKLSSSGRTLGLRCLRRAGCRGGYAGRA